MMMNLNRPDATEALKKIADTEINMNPALETAYEQAYGRFLEALDRIDSATLKALRRTAEDARDSSDNKGETERYDAIDDTLYFLRTLQRKEGSEAKMEFVRELAKKHLYTIADARSQIEADARFNEGGVAEAVHQLERVVDNLSQLHFPSEREAQERDRKAKQADFIAAKREQLRKIGIS